MPDDVDDPNAEGEGQVPASAADAFRAAHDTSSLEADLAEGGEGEDAQLTREPEQPEGAPPAEAASPSDDEGTPPEVDPDDPETWPEEYRRTDGQYKHSRFELARALHENKRSFQTELDKEVDRRLDRILSEREEQPEGRRPAEAKPPEPSPREQEISGTMQALSQRFDQNEVVRLEVERALVEDQRLSLHLEGVLTDLHEQLKEAGDDELFASRLQQRIEQKTYQKQLAEGRVETNRLRHVRISAVLDQDKRHYGHLKSQREGLIAEESAIEDRRQRAAVDYEAATRNEQRALGSALDETAKKLGVPDSKRERFNHKLLRSLKAEDDIDSVDLLPFFEREGREELNDWSASRAEGAVSYGAAKRRDVSQGAPSAVAKVIDRKPMSRREADRIAMQASRRIPI